MPHRSGQLKPGRVDAWRPAGVVSGLRRALPVGRRRLLIDGGASQAERPQPRSFFPHRTQFGLVPGHCLLALMRLLFVLKQPLGATMPLIGIRAHWNSFVKPHERITCLSTLNRLYLRLTDQTDFVPEGLRCPDKLVCRSSERMLKIWLRSSE